MKENILARLQLRLAALVAALLAVSVLLAILFVPEGSERESSAPDQIARRVLIISLDGLDTRYLHDREKLGLKIPTLSSLMRGGATAEGVISVYPSVTYPAHVTMITGAYPARHGIYTNEVHTPPDQPQTGDWHWFARDIRVKTLWDVAAQKGLKTGMVSWPASAGAGDFNFPEIWKPGGSREQTAAVVISNARPNNLVSEVQSADASLFSRWTSDEGDDMRTRFAEFIIEKKRPEVMLVHLFDLDHFQHAKGPFTSDAYSMLEKVDVYVARILAAAERAGTLKDTVVFVVSDHGFLPVSRLVKPGVLLAKNGLVTLDPSSKATVTSWKAMVHPTSGSCSIILRDRADAETLAILRRLFYPLAGKDGTGIARVYDSEEIRQMGGDPRAAFVLEAADGYSFASGYTGDLIIPSRDRGAHGYLPTRADYRASLIISGPGVQAGKDLGTVRMIDIGPTAVQILGLKLRDAEGKPIPIR